MTATYVFKFWWFQVSAPLRSENLCYVGNLILNYFFNKSVRDNNSPFELDPSDSVGKT